MWKFILITIVLFNVNNIWEVHCEDATLESRVGALENLLEETRRELQTTSEEISALTNKDETKRFLMDDEGNPIMFTAQLQSHLDNLGDKQPIKFDYIVSNNGSGYDPQTGVFTSPSRGNFLFIVTLMCHFREWFEAQMVVNGNQVMPVYAGSSTHFNQGTASVIVRLNAGDRVWVETFHNTLQGNTNINVYGIRWSSFTGMRVSI